MSQTPMYGFSRKYFFPIFLALTILVLNDLHAEHIIGGEMSYTCTGDGQYAFTMKLYRDCFSSGADFDSPAHFGVYGENGNLIVTIQSFPNAVQNINTNVASPCMVLPPNVCVEEGIYSFNVTVPDTTIGYKVVYQRCCRNGTIQNLTNPGAQGLTIESTIPPFAEVGCNSSPSFTNFPPPVLCAQELLLFDHSATDQDGDSLAYSLCSPFTGGSQDVPAPVPPSAPPYPEVTWAPGFTAGNPLQGNPGLSIDSITGSLSGVPTLLGQYVIGVCVEEWRNGQLLSVNTRDFQFNVAFCEPPSAAVINTPNVEDLCEDLTVNFSSPSAPSNNFAWDFGDEESEVDDSSELINPIYTFSDTGTYVVTLITNPGFFCSDTATLILPIYLSAEINASLSDVVCTEGEQFFSFAAQGIFEPESPIVWNFGTNATPNTFEGASAEGIVFGAEGPQEVSVTVINNNCTTSDEITVVVEPQVTLSIDPQTEFCTGLTYQFSQQSTNASFFSWNFGTGSDAGTSTEANPIFTFPENGQYNVSLTASGAGNCPVTVEETFDIRTLLQPEVPEYPILCYEDHNVQFEALGAFGPDAEFTWSFENAVNPVASGSLVNNVVFLEPGTHPFSLTVSENGCTRSAEGSITLHVYPRADFSGQPLRGCAPLSVAFSNLSETQSSNALFTWDFGDGSPTRSVASTHTYHQPGIYTVSLQLENLNGCIGTDERVREAYIEVLPTPKPGFSMEPVVVSTFDPEFSLTDGSQGANSVVYFIEGQELFGPDLHYTLQNIAPQTITQRVTNGEGCTAETSLTFRVTDHLIYVPNAFSPNGDGLNDLFAPVLQGVMKYDMYIIDRWGQEVFAQENVQRGWDGNDGGGAFFAPAGMYQYLIIVSDYSGWLFEYKGHVNLLR